MRVNYARDAREEGIEAAAWYGSQEKGLQNRFLEKWKDAENRMAANPGIHRCFEGELRKCRFDVFPYALVFRIRSDELQVLAVMHMSRRPGYWKKRGGN
ncbi:MAG: type II toxin-antitoxin system RelE/ParE family toxin [Luteolibacter sp.]|jgi:plasmid stabilization system protein ParE|nr:type II toxin-antitoxin system RelE/ParE family toxin [Luteolibacter sp.]